VARALLEPWLASATEGEREELLAGFAILHALYWLVVRRAEGAPLLVVVDDGQWVDEPSLRFLVYLLGRLSDQPIALLVAARAGARGEGGLLEQLGP
jgi:predicted ATPase